MLDELSEGVEDAATAATPVFTGVLKGFTAMALPVLLIGLAVALSGLLLRAPAKRLGRVV